MGKIETLQSEIEDLKAMLETGAFLSAEQKQLISDEISKKKREIEKSSIVEQKVTSVPASIIAERKQNRKTRFSNNSFRL